MRIEVLPLTDVSKIDLLRVTEDGGKISNEHVEQRGDHHRNTSCLAVEDTVQMSVIIQAKEVETEESRSIKMEKADWSDALGRRQYLMNYNDCMACTSIIESLS